MNEQGKSATGDAAARVRRACGLALALLASTAFSGAHHLDNDIKLTLAARASLAGDERLRDLDLGISVKQNVARLWGSVPSADLAQRAVDRARRVAGIARVVDQLVVESPDDPLVQFLKTPKLSPVFGQALLAKPVEPVVPEWREPAASVPPGAFARRPAAEPPPGNQWWSPARDITPTMPVLRVPVPGERSGVLASGGNRPTSGVERALDQLRRSQPRWHGLRWEMDGGLVRFLGPVSDWAALHELARHASRLPGVERVVLPGP